MGGIDGDGSWAVLSDLSLEVVLVALNDVDVGGNGADGLGSVEGACLSAGLVRVVGLCVELTALVGNNVVEGSVHETAIAAGALCDAVDEVLL